MCRAEWSTGRVEKSTAERRDSASSGEIDGRAEKLTTGLSSRRVKQRNQRVCAACCVEKSARWKNWRSSKEFGVSCGEISALHGEIGGRLEELMRQWRSHAEKIDDRLEKS